jgi:hypothetical protein
MLRPRCGHVLHHGCSILRGNPNHFRRKGAAYPLRALIRRRQADLIKLVAGF